MSAPQGKIYDNDECFNCQVFRKSKRGKKSPGYSFIGNGHALPTNKDVKIASDLFYFYISPEEPSGHEEWFDLRSHDVVYLLLGLEESAPMLAFEVILTESTSDAPPYNTRYIMRRRDDLHIAAGAPSDGENEHDAPIEEVRRLNDELFDRLRLLGSAARTWLQFDRAELKRRVHDKVTAHFRAAPSPEPREGIENGLSFLGFLLQDGSTHSLYNTAMQQLDETIFNAVSELDEDEQIALLLPMVDVDDLAADWDVTDWARVLRTRLADEWEDELRSIVLQRIEFTLAIAT